MRRGARSIVLAAALALAAPPSPVLAEHDPDAYPEHPPSEAAMMTDALIVRPLMLGVTAFGLATFIVSLPFTAPGGNVQAAGERLVAEPARETFLRPLGAPREDRR